MELGFDTIGNATLVVYDHGPLLVTDPWFADDPYFGSWTLSHEIPAEQMAAIRSAPFCWISHGHPDHLSVASLREMGVLTILLPDHVGGRIAAALRHDGFEVRVLPDRVWVPLSDRVRVCCLADYNQDAVLLVDIDGCLVIDANDAVERGWRHFVRGAARRSRVSFLLQLASFGDPDMINLFDEDGHRIPSRVDRREPIGRTSAFRARQLGARFVVPFSSMHRYQRADSVWANEHVATLADHAEGFDSARSELLPAFTRYDCLRDLAEPIEPRERSIVVRAPAEFGDSWDEPLDDADRGALDAYFLRIEHLARCFDFVAFDVGGTQHTVRVGAPRGEPTGRGLTFNVPRASLMSAVTNEVFDDLLIGNFARTIVHGVARGDALYPDFTPYVGKYADNGAARSEAELEQYFRAYRRRAPLEYLRHQLERRAIDRVRGLTPRGSRRYTVARRAYQRLVAAPTRRR